MTFIKVLVSILHQNLTIGLHSTPVKFNYSVSRHIGDFIKKHFYKIS